MKSRYDNSMNQIKKGAMISYLAIGVSLLSGLLYTPWMVKQIGVNDYGLYTLATSLISIFLIDFGISEAVSRFISKYNAEGNQQKVNDFLGLIYKLYFFIDLLIFLLLIIMYFFIPVIYSELTPEEIDKFKVIYMITSAFSIISLPFITLNGILTSYEKFKTLKLSDLVHKLIVLTLMVIALMLGYKLYALVLVNVFAGLLIIVIKLFYIHNTLPIKVNIKFWETKLLKEVFGFSIWSTVSTFANRFIFSIIPSILGAVSGSSQIAIFGVASTLESYAYIISGAVNGMFLPKVSKILTNKNDGKDVLPLMIKVGRIQYSIIGLIFIGFTVVGKEFIYLWMGKDFDLAYYCALLMMLPGVFRVPQQIASITIIAMNKVRIQAFIYVIVAILNILFSSILSQYFGALGAAISICLVYFIRLIIMNIIYYKVLHINIFSFIKACYIDMAPPMLITLIVGIIINHFTAYSLWIFLIKGTFIVVLYIILLWKMSLNHYEKSLIKNI
ncbi:oligosaccharide flippase family protein [Lachnospiraceae bacterium MD1]|uniref:Oligosaccharide flippase family protein n=1 Tax=Variimorphobacter saccharofermentans TaxID=2755051 RepID=A0A839K1Z5_9FIRM|nr:oligosaccharide flippase family protein [Variimorphobacter saccharofermentans]MBB2183428.1 oligosaccharide flippase family protein [Variimorphobacter saccharofermentans]